MSRYYARDNYDDEDNAVNFKKRNKTISSFGLIHNPFAAQVANLVKMT